MNISKKNRNLFLILSAAFAILMFASCVVDAPNESEKKEKKNFYEQYCYSYNGYKECFESQDEVDAYLSAYPDATLECKLTITCTEAGLEIYKTGSVTWIHNNFYVSTEDGISNVYAAFDESECKFTYPFVKKGKKYQFYISMNNSKWNDEWKTDKLIVKSKGGLGNYNFTYLDAAYDSDTKSIFYKDMKVVCPEEVKDTAKFDNKYVYGNAYSDGWNYEGWFGGLTLTKSTLTLSDEAFTNLSGKTSPWMDANYDFNYNNVKYIVNVLNSSTLFEEKSIDTSTLNGLYDYTKSTRDSTLEACSYNLPVIYITTTEDVTEHEYYDCYIDVTNCDSEYELQARKGQIKVRGNSTSNNSSKPYRIKFNNKQGMLGLHDGKEYKSWVLLNTNDGQDYLGFKLINEIYKTSTFKYYGSDVTFVHVYLNGDYKGMRLLCEQSQVGDDRVDITEPEEGDTSLKTGYFMCLDNYAYSKYTESPCFTMNNVNKYNVKYGSYEKNFSKQRAIGTLRLKYPECTVYNWLDGFGDGYNLYGNSINQYTSEEYYFKDVLNHDIQNFQINWGNNNEIFANDHYIPEDSYSIKSDTWSNEQRAYIAKWMNNVWEICYQSIVGDSDGNKHYLTINKYGYLAKSSYTNSKEAVSAVIDVESLINEMILEELIRDNDVGAGSFYMAVDFTKSPSEKYGRLTFECPWDNNWAYGSSTEASAKFGNDDDYYGDGPRYYAGAFQRPLNEGCERSNFWFTLLNKEEWFRQMARQRWEKIGASNLQNVVTNVSTETAEACAEGSFSVSGVTSYVANRITEIENTLWIE